VASVHAAKVSYDGNRRMKDLIRDIAGMVLGAIERIEQMTGLKLDWRYEDEARKGDHICYISNLGKFQTHYPNWKITRGLETILKEIISSQRGQLAKTSSS